MMFLQDLLLLLLRLLLLGLLLPLLPSLLLLLLGLLLPLPSLLLLPMLPPLLLLLLLLLPPLLPLLPLLLPLLPPLLLLCVLRLQWLVLMRQQHQLLLHHFLCCLPEVLPDGVCLKGALTPMHTVCHRLHNNNNRQSAWATSWSGADTRTVQKMRLVSHLQYLHLTHTFMKHTAANQDMLL
jgi:hypothetical protein